MVTPEVGSFEIRLETDVAGDVAGRVGELDCRECDASAMSQSTAPALYIKPRRTPFRKSRLNLCLALVLIIFNKLASKTSILTASLSCTTLSQPSLSSTP